ncbi:(R)-mandelonitrile lyase-like isoform X2 [Tasmannia lanceolata]|uniref:(R)-mandelonitrile lyase-like isoform X2 n=1 Tax=Tasmannia lanceolata TaxID=3420 RepID=UPI004062A54A
MEKPLFLLCLLVPTFAQSLPRSDPNYLRFVSDAREFPAEEEYDYIIVGGGTAGCPLAATLSENYKVLVLERGGTIQSYPNLMTQEGFLRTLLEADRTDSPAQPFTSEDGVPNARGRVLGGSSAINAGFYSRADQEFFRQGGVWNMDMVNRSFAWVERAVTFRPELKNWQSAVRDGLVEANVTPYNGFTVDHVLGTKIGASTFDSNGLRYSAADLLDYASVSNIKVAIHASVERIILNGGSESKLAAIGVVYRDQSECLHHAMLRPNGEVILSAGAIGSPQLLLLSGIGPRPYLSSWGIPVAHHLPSVGQYLYDNPRNGISIVPPTQVDHSLIQVVGITDSGVFLEAASNILPFSPTRSTFLPNPPPSLYVTVATLMQKVGGPLSFGSLRLSSTDVRDNPVVRFNYFSNPEDLERCVRGLSKIREVLRGRAMEEFRFSDRLGRREFRFVGPALPAEPWNVPLLERFCRQTVMTIWHYHGGCVMGKVVDDEYRVMGVDSLRVVDGSTFSVSPGTNPQATLMMIGRKGMWD